ncbi:hypothetical protein [Nocardioides dilutus]
MRFLKNLAVSLLATTVLVTTTAAASAESVDVPDPTGDAPRAIDATGMRVDNAQHAVRIRLHFGDLRRSRVRSVTVEMDVGKLLGRGYVIVFERRASGGFTKRLSWVRLYSEGGTTLPRCARLRLAWTKDRADIRLPRSCMSKAHDERVRANVRIVSVTQRRERVPNKFLTFSPWVSHG